MNLSSPFAARPRKAVQAMGQYFDFGSFADFFSSGFGTTLTNLATTVAGTEIKQALGPAGSGGASPQPVIPVHTITTVPQSQVFSSGYVATPALTYNAVIPGTPNNGLPVQPSAPGATPQSWLGDVTGGAPIVSGVSNQTLMLIGGAVLLVLLLRR